VESVEQGENKGAINKMTFLNIFDMLGWGLLTLVVISAVIWLANKDW